MIDTLIQNIMHTLFPFTIYLFYVAYKSKEDKRENELFIIVTIFSSLYITLKYNNQITENIPMLLINIPLIISYYKKNIISIIISSITMIAYYYNFYNGYLIIFIIEYLAYYLIYIKSKNPNTFIILFTIIKTLIIILISYLNATIVQNILNIILCNAIFAITSIFIFYLIKKAEDILRIHLLYKEIKHDKQIRTSLFQITHEIKNPIAVCKGYLDMFDTNNQDHAEKYVPILKEEIDKVLVLLEDFLAMNRIKINKDIMDINCLLEDIKTNHNLYFEEKNIDITFDITDEEIYINGDYNRLTQVFVNIIKNSIEALKDNPKIKIWTKKSKDKINIYFKDNGEGIPKDILEKIKEPFFTTKIKGTGLGVALSDEIIKAHGGTLNYQSEEGKYTLVTITLPTIEL